MELKYDKGVAGLTILLSLVTFLFIMGLLIMVFALMGGGLSDATSETVSGSGDEEIVFTNGTGIELSAPEGASLDDIEVSKCIGLGC